MTLLNRLMVSGGSEVLLTSLDININGNTYRIIDAYEDVTLGGNVYTACALELHLPKRNTDGSQSLKLAISNIQGVGSTQLRTAIEAGTKGTVTVTTYTSDDLDNPVGDSYTMDITKASWTALQVTLTCAYMNILDKAFLRKRYTLSFAPGLRWM